MLRVNLDSVADHPILLYDGVCGLCNRVVQFVLRRDRRGVFRFAALQSPLAARILARHGIDPGDLDTFYVVVESHFNDAGAQRDILFARSDAVLFILNELGGFWRLLESVFRIAPRGLREWGYRLVARHRYQMFGRYDSCPLPSAETRERFLEL